MSLSFFLPSGEETTARGKEVGRRVGRRKEEVGVGWVGLVVG